MLLTIAATCLALNIYHEARGQNVAGQYAVALVTMNRAKNDIDQVCPVVLKRKQFSWTNRNVRFVNGKYSLKARAVPKDMTAYGVAVVIAREILTGRVSDFTGGATFYHELRVHPAWRLAMTRTKVIGQHVFYRLA